MGLGKTLQTIALLAYIRQHHKGALTTIHAVYVSNIYNSHCRLP